MNCPKCGSEMEYWVNEEEINEESPNEARYLMEHVYLCPCCGHEEKVKDQVK